MRTSDAQYAGQLREYVATLAPQLLSTAPLDTIFQSGIFLQGDFDQTTETFVCDALVENLGLAGAKVVSLNARKLTDGKGLATLSEAILAQIGEPVRDDPPGLLLDTVRRATADGATLAMVIGGIETLGRPQEGTRVLQALKACRDAVNLPPEGKGRFLLIGIGRSPEVAALTADSLQAFYGAALIAIRTS
jgi:hypothetical protein